MEKQILIINPIEYLDKILFLAHCRVQCSLAEIGLEKKGTANSSILPREEINIRLEDAFIAAGKDLQEGSFLPLEYLFRLFDCDSFERHAVLVTLLAQTSADIAPYFSLINNDKDMPVVTPLALCRTFEEQGDYLKYSAYFARGSKLLKVFMLKNEVDIYSGLALDRRILEFILGVKVEESYYSPIASLWTRESSSGEDEFYLDIEAAHSLLACLQNSHDFDLHSLFNLFGEKGAGRKNCIKYIARESGLNLMFIDLLHLTYEKEPLILTDKIIRECLIFQAVPVIINLDQEIPVSMEALISYLLSAICDYFDYSFIITEQEFQPRHLEEDVLFIAKEFGKISLETAVRLWKKESQQYMLDKDLNFYEIAGEFTLTPGGIKKAVRAAQAIADMHNDGIITARELKRGCYNSLHFTMGTKAIKLETIYTWDDLILPQYQKDRLLTACNQVRYKYMVYQKWGFQDKMSYGKNVSMLFTGPPGTGKTMAAQVVSQELGLELYKIELATVVSKYVGETEKNLNEIFQQAKKSQVILFFDEADVLFSKRTEVKDANDKYSNMEAAFLLQKMEEYDGISILATNYIQNFDEAFKRRIKFVIDFPFPSPEQRQQIWQKVFPPQLPLGELDYDYLTQRFELSGSNIKNIALHSAFLAAAEDSEKVEMRHIVAAIRNEYAKSGKIFTKEDAGEYYMLLQ